MSRPSARPKTSLHCKIDFEVYENLKEHIKQKNHGTIPKGSVGRVVEAVIKRWLISQEEEKKGVDNSGGI